MRSDLPVVILKLRASPLHSGSLGMVRSLGRLGIELHVLGEQGGSPLGRSRYVRTGIARPSDSSPEQLAQWIHDQAPTGGALLVPVDDDGAIFVQQHADILDDAYVFPRLPHGLVRKIVGKDSLSALAASAGVPTPKHSIPSTRRQLEDFLARSTFPVVVKKLLPGALGRPDSTRSVDIVDTAETVRDLWAQHLVGGSPNCLLQEYIPGGPETVWMVNAYANEHSDLHFAASGRKLRQSPPTTGATSLGICEHNEKVIGLTAQLVKHIGYRGIVDIGWRFDERDSEYKLLDFNPRIGATFRLFVGRRGMDVLRACYLDMTGQPVEPDEVSDGRKWINEARDTHVAATELLNNRLAVAEYVRSVRGVEETTWWARDDAVPALTMIADGTNKLLSRRARNALTRPGLSRLARPTLASRQQ